MPELAEVKIMSDFINAVVGEESFFQSIEKSPVSKVKTDLNPFEGGIFTMYAKARGKELLLHLETVGGDVDKAVTKNLLCTMGMSGNWLYISKSSPKLETAFKHGHLRFQTVSGNWLILHDVRRFAKWKWVEGFSKDRSPCPLTEFNEFQQNLLENWYKDKYFNRPLSEVMMNQSAFNGVGNYLRAEIIFRLGIDPFQSANALSVEELHELIKITHMCVRDAYELGGGQLKDWYNPNGVDGKNFNEWIKCYGKLASIVDGSGRKFWYHPQWKSPSITPNDI